jgi:hypothetical protein
MKLSVIIMIGLCGLATLTIAQPAPVGLERYAMLLGNWRGEGGGTPGQGGGTFSFSYDLDKKIIVRTSHSVYPATKDKPGIVHDDLMIVYPDTGTAPDRAIYFDNEGHVIRYYVSFAGRDTIVFTGEKTPIAPLFRLSYEKIDWRTVNVKFEISMDGEKYTTYIAGRSKKMIKIQE